MIGAYHGTADYPAAEILAVNPLRRRRKPLRGFRGCDRSGSTAQRAAMP